jgi:hypothetical protein
MMPLRVTTTTWPFSRLIVSTRPSPGRFEPGPISNNWPLRLSTTARPEK